MNKLKQLQQKEKNTFQALFGAMYDDPFEYTPSASNTLLFILFIYGPLVPVILLSFWLQRTFGNADITRNSVGALIIGYGVIAFFFMSLYSKRVVKKHAPAGNTFFEKFNAAQQNTHLNLQQTKHAFHFPSMSVGFSVTGTYTGYTVEYKQESTVTGRSGGGTTSRSDVSLLIQGMFNTSAASEIKIRKPLFRKYAATPVGVLATEIEKMLGDQRTSILISLSPNQIKLTFGGPLPGAFTLHGAVVRIHIGAEIAKQFTRDTI